MSIYFEYFDNSFFNIIFLILFAFVFNFNYKISIKGKEKQILRCIKIILKRKKILLTREIARDVMN